MLYIEKRGKHIYYLLAIVVLAAILRLPAFLYNYVNIDETDYTLAAQVILDGGLPYRDFLIYQPPVIFYLYTLGFYLAGGWHLYAVHIITTVYVAGTVAFLYLLVSSMTSSKKGGFAAALAYAVYSFTFIPQDMLAANCEILMMLPMIAGAYFLHRGGLSAESGGRRYLIHYLLAGIMMGIGIMTKYQGGIILASAFVYVALVRPLVCRRFRAREVIYPAAVMVIGFFIPLAAVILFFASHGAFGFAREAFEYIILYAKGPPQNDILYIILKFIIRSILFALPGLPMWIGAVYIICRAVRRKFRDPEIPAFTAFLALWFFSGIAPITAGGRMYFHYYFIILPAAAALSGIWWALRGSMVSKTAKLVILAWAVICVAGWETYDISKALRPPGGKETWVNAAEYLKEIAKPGDTMFVWGCCYQLHFVSGIKSGSRFTAADLLTGRSPMTAGTEYNPADPNPPGSLAKVWYDFADRPGVIEYDTSEYIFPKAWQYLDEDFEKRLPTYIVDTSGSNYRRYGRYPIRDFPYLQDVIRRNYKLIKSIDGYDIYKVEGGP